MLQHNNINIMLILSQTIEREKNGPPQFWENWALVMNLGRRNQFSLECCVDVEENECSSFKILVFFIKPIYILIFKIQYKNIKSYFHLFIPISKF